jgi:thiol-disulfide isomerase/thioredoxin
MIDVIALQAVAFDPQNRSALPVVAYNGQPNMICPATIDSRPPTRLVAPETALCLIVGALTAASAARAAVKPQEVVDRAVAAYRALDNYRDRIEYRFAYVATDEAGKALENIDTLTGSLAFKKPDRFIIVNDTAQFRFHRDGTHRWVIHNGLYTRSAAPAVPDFDSAVPYFLRGPEPTHPVTQTLKTPEASFAAIFPGVRELGGAKAEARSGIDGVTVTGKVAHELTQAPIDFEAWFADADGLVREIRLDLTASMRENLTHRGERAEAEGLKHCELLIRLEDVAVNEEPAGATFSFQPGDNDQEVDEINFETIQQAMVGRPAPDFEIPDLDSLKPVSLKDFRGRVVILDFWATWCGPCLMAMPRIQTVADRFAQQPVTFLGVNSDQRERRNAALQFMRQKNLTMPQVWDERNAVNATYLIQGIPSSIIIDQQGIVQAIHTGYAPGHTESKLHQEITTLLSGKSLHQGEDLKTRMRRLARRGRR